MSWSSLVYPVSSYVIPVPYSWGDHFTATETVTTTSPVNNNYITVSMQLQEPLEPMKTQSPTPKEDGPELIHPCEGYSFAIDKENSDMWNLQKIMQLMTRLDFPDNIKATCAAHMNAHALTIGLAIIPVEEDDQLCFHVRTVK